MARLQLITKIGKCKYNATKVHGCGDSNHQDAVMIDMNKKMIASVAGTYCKMGKT